jgi:hypothetical protein
MPPLNFVLELRGRRARGRADFAFHGVERAPASAVEIIDGWVGPSDLQKNAFAIQHPHRYPADKHINQGINK